MGKIFKKGFTEVIRTYEKWWNREIDRPLIPIVLTGHDSDRVPSRYPYLAQTSFADLSITEEDFIDSIDYALSSLEFLGDSFPHLNGNYSGPGIVAAFLGADIRVSSEGRIWFHSQEVKDIRDLHFEYDPNNKWLERIKNIMTAGYKRWGDEVLIGLPDLGGVMDALAVFRTTEGLAYDLYDYPNEVKRAINEIANLWRRYFLEIAQSVPRKIGYSDWSNILSASSAYMTQCDYCYMIGTDMFDEFVKPELADTYNMLDRGYYHLDGVGAANHIDSLLEIKNLELVQWVPGDGTTDENLWEDIYRKILDSGKHLQIVNSANADSLKQLDNIVKKCGGKGIVFGEIRLDISQRKQAYEILSQYKVM